MMPSIFHLLSSSSDPIHPWSAWVYVLLAVFVAVEGPIATLAAAIASSGGYLDPVFVFLSASFGNLTADILWYSLGYAGKLEWLIHHGKWLGITEESVERLKQDINNHVGKVLFVAKLTLGLVVPTLVAAGLARVPWKRWAGALFGAEFIWTGGLVLAGYYYGQYVLRIEKGLEWLSIGSGILLVAVLIFYFARRRSYQDHS